jgi:sulfur-oxidizing protein SoxX
MPMKLGTLAGLLAVTLAAPLLAEPMDPAKVEAAVAAAWPKLSPEMQARVDMDEVQALCTLYRNDPPADVAEKIVAAAQASVVYPADGALMGDWKVALKESNNGYGWRIGDDPKRLVGGNCYACHQLDRKEVAYGTLGPSLLGYGGGVPPTGERIREVYAKIYNSQTVLACSQMPRLGHNRYLSPEQIRDYVALLLDPASPVNK